MTPDIAWGLSLLDSTYGYLLGLAVQSHTVPLQLLHKPCISHIDRFQSLLSEFSTLHPLPMLLHLLSWLGLRVWH